MSTALPIVDGPKELVALLLQEQGELSAVEQFSNWHAESDGPAQEKYYRSLLPASPPGPQQQFAFEVDLDACSGCKACVVACHTLNGLEENESWRRVGTLVIGDSENESAAIQHVTTACHHCEDPGCLNGCPVKAYDKDPVTGIVRHLDDQCIGCKYCTMMCPYEVPRYSDRLGIVRKCDMCHQRLSVGEAPACVQSCPNEAIRIVVVPAEGKKPTPDVALVPTAPRSEITRPTTRYASTRNLDPATTRSQDDAVDEVAESHWPLAAMLVTTQVAVGILLFASIGFLALRALSVEVPQSVWLASAVAAFLIGNVGLGIAPLHLGQPLRMWRVFLGLRTSWLSREAVILGKFMGLLAAGIGVLALHQFWDSIPAGVQGMIPIDWTPPWVGELLCVASIPLGIAGLFSSAMIYIATQRQLWRFGRTLPRFFGTMLVGGPIALAVALSLFEQHGLAAVMSLLTVAAAAWKLSWERKFYFASATASAESIDPYDERSLNLIHHELSQLKWTRMALGTAAIVASLMTALFCVAGSDLGWLVAALATLLVVGGEYCERLLYFQSVVYDRMPKTL